MKGPRSYFDWIERQTRRPGARRDLTGEHQVAPSEPLEVEEHATIIERIRAALRDRFTAP